MEAASTRNPHPHQLVDHLMSPPAAHTSVLPIILILSLSATVYSVYVVSLVPSSQLAYISFKTGCMHRYRLTKQVSRRFRVWRSGWDANHAGW